MIDSCNLFVSTLGVNPNENKSTLVGLVENKAQRLSHQNPDCANSNDENPPNRIKNWFYEHISVENLMELKSESSSCKYKAQRQLRPELFFLEFLKSPFAGSVMIT